MAHGFGCEEHGFHNARIRAAAADVTLHAIARLGAGGRSVFREESGRGEDHTRGTEAALEGFHIEESLLDGVKFTVRGKSFDGGDGLVGDGGSFHQAGMDFSAADQNRTSPTFVFAAAVLGSGVLQEVAEEGQEGRFVRGLGCEGATVDAQSHERLLNAS